MTKFYPDHFVLRDDQLCRVPSTRGPEQWNKIKMQIPGRCEPGIG
jgi:hypothetical protein